MVREANHVLQSGAGGQPGHPAEWGGSGSTCVPAHCALEAVVVVEAAPLAEATVKSEFCRGSAELEAA